MAIIHAAGDWDSGEVVAVRMVSGRKQIEDIKRIAGLQEATLSFEEKQQIEQRRAQAAERKDLLRAQAERKRHEASELQSKLARRRAREQMQDDCMETEAISQRVVTTEPMALVESLDQRGNSFSTAPTQNIQAAVVVPPTQEPRSTQRTHEPVSVKEHEVAADGVSLVEDAFAQSTKRLDIRASYEYAVIDPSEYPACDKFRDFFFRKHCSVARFLETTSGDYILFVFDGDNPVVWLDRGLDHWLKEVAATDVVLYERWMNNEIMAGNYAVRNSDFGIRFLDDWASFEEELPRSGYHSSDNGAIHLHLLRVLGLKNEKPCKYQWDHLGSDRDHMDEYYGFVTCARLVMGAPRRWKIAGTPRVTILPRGHAWAIDGGDADSHVSSVGAISHHGQKTEANYRQYFQDSFVDNGGSDCDAMVRKGFYVDPRQYGESLLSKLKARTDGAMLDWTRQHVPPWDFAYLGCMATLSCRPLDDGEALPVSIPRPIQSSIPFKKVPKDAKFEVCAGEWETCKCVGFVYFGTKTRRSPVVEVQAGEGKIDCRADNFDGDPAIGEIKKCHCAPAAEKTCDALLSTSGDPFREVQAASLCQRLGLLKQDVDFGGRNQVMHFDSSLLEKAHRVLQMETYAEVQEMARALIQDFESLCKVLLHLNDNQAKPELKENAELTSAILRLEQVWADCQFILHQGCLDFIEVLEREVLPQLSPMLRWQIGIALGCSEGRPLDPDVTQADIKAAKVALYQTVPMMVYVEELWRDANPEESSCVYLLFGCQYGKGGAPVQLHGNGYHPPGMQSVEASSFQPSRRVQKRILRSRIYDDSKPTGLRSLRRLQSPKELTAALSELGRRQHWHDALSAMQILADAGRSRLVSIEALNAAITCCSSGTWQGSLALLSTASIMSLRHSLVTAGAAIKVAGAQSAHGSLAEQSNWHNALHRLCRMRQHSMIPNIRHHNAILSCSLSWSTALCIFNSVLNYELEPTEFTSSLLMKKLETNWPLAIHSFLSMQRLRLEHDAISGNAALRAAGAGNHRRVSREFLQHLISAGVPVDSATCSSAGSALDSERIWDLLQDVRASVVQPDLGAYTSVLGAFDNDGRWEAALGVLRSMAMDGVQAGLNPYAAAQSACERCRQWMEVVDLIRALKGSSAQLDLVVRSAAVSAPQTGGSWRIALQSFCQLALETLAPDVVSHGAVLSAAEAGHQWHSAISALWSWSRQFLKPDVISCNSAVSACEKAKSWATAVNIVTQDMAWCRILPDAISCSSAILACTDTSCWGQGLLMVSFAQQQDITPQVGSFGALLTECERASPSLVACQQELLSGSLRAAGLDQILPEQRKVPVPRRKLRFVELCCPQDDRHHTLRRDFGKFDEKRFNEFRTFITDDEQNRGGANRQTDFFRLVYRQLKAVAAFPVQENFAAAVLAASKAQENLKQPGLSDQDIAVVQREQELLEGGARWICLMLKVQAVAPGLFPKKPSRLPAELDRNHSSDGTPAAARMPTSKPPWEKPGQWLLIVTYVPELDTCEPHSLLVAEGDQFMAQQTDRGWRLAVEKLAHSTAREQHQNQAATAPPSHTDNNPTEPATAAATPTGGEDDEDSEGANDDDSQDGRPPRLPLSEQAEPQMTQLGDGKWQIEVVRDKSSRRPATQSGLPKTVIEGDGGPVSRAPALPIGTVGTFEILTPEMWLFDIEEAPDHSSYEADTMLLVPGDRLLLEYQDGSWHMRIEHLAPDAPGPVMRLRQRRPWYHKPHAAVGERCYKHMISTGAVSSPLSV
ncbi:unnamed protein product, partial [Symbiodinium microadriaticum]